ncbi:MAG: GntR family transcriptional regulator [Kiritimatiellia bacterium]
MQASTGQSETKQKTVFRALRDDILNGRYSSGRFPSERALMSRFAISRSLVREVIRELKFEGFLVCRQGSGTFVTKGARNLGGRIGLVVPGVLHEEIFPPICREISNLAQKEGFTMLFGEITEEDYDRRAARIRALVAEYIRQNVSGVIFQPMEFLEDSPRINAQIVKAFRDAGVSVVLLDYDFVPPPGRSTCDLVAINNFEAGRRMGEHLVHAGAKRIAFMMKDNWAFSVLNRCEGVRHVAQAHGCAARDFVLHVEPTDVAAIAAILRHRRAPDAIVCGNDTVAARLLVTLRKLGIAVPEKVRVSGFDDVAHASFVQPPLTTIRMPCREIAWMLFEVLLRRMREPDRPTTTVYLNAPLVIRDSTGTNGR